MAHPIFEIQSAFSHRLDLDPKVHGLGIDLHRVFALATACEPCVLPPRKLSTPPKLGSVHLYAVEINRHDMSIAIMVNFYMAKNYFSALEESRQN